MIPTLILFAQLASTHFLPPDPKWVETPVPHWSCPGFRVENRGVPQCVPLGKTDAMLFGFNPATEEVISWGWVKTVPASGKLRVEYPPEFLRMPGCEVIDKTDEVTNEMRFSKESNAGFTIHAKPGHKLHLNCHGVIGRMQ